jgi:hypothetical protein
VLLASITLPSSVTSIGNSAFRSCTAFTSINIPSGCHTIGSYAFYGCSALTSINIPSGVTTIESNTFYGCKNMQVYDFSTHTSVPTLANKNAFTSIPSTCKIKVPSSLLNDWKTATNWSTYASRIVAA